MVACPPDSIPADGSFTNISTDHVSKVPSFSTRVSLSRQYVLNFDTSWRFGFLGLTSVGSLYLIVCYIIIIMGLMVASVDSLITTWLAGFVAPFRMTQSNPLDTSSQYAPHSCGGFVRCPPSLSALGHEMGVCMRKGNILGAKTLSCGESSSTNPQYSNNTHALFHVFCSRIHCTSEIRPSLAYRFIL